MSKRIYLYILLVATFFCSSCNFSASEEKFLNESELSFSISRNVLAQIDSSVETTVTIHTEVLKENTVIIDNLQDRKLLFNENNEPYLESITLNKVPLYCPLVLKMQVLIGDNLFAEGQSEEVVFSRKNKRLNLQLAVVLQDEPEIELKIYQTSIGVEEWEENATFTATEGFDSYNWTCGDQRGYESEFTVDLSKLSVGEHKVNLTATKGTKTYTAETTFKVEAKIKFEEITQSEVNIINESKEIINGYEKLIFKASEGFDSYTWKYANKNVSGNSIELDTSTLPLGKYVLQLLAVKNGIEYSAQVEFRIEQKLSFNIEIADLEIIKLKNNEGSIELKATDGFDSYKWICENLTYEGQNITIQYTNLLNFEMYVYVLVRVVAVKDGVEYSEEKYIGELLYEEN